MGYNVTTMEILSRMLTKPFRAIYSVFEKKKCNELIFLAQDNKFHIKYKNKSLKFGDSSCPYELYEQFYEEQYKWLNVNGKTVIDIGGGTGDTAIYFILNGAKEVYAFEPDGKRYDAAIKNHKENMVKNVHHIKKEITSLDEIKYYWRGRKRDKLLKCDCEGAEHYILKNSSPNSIRSFSQIMLEFHNGYIDLKRILEEQGFDVKYSFSKYWSADFNGIITALPQKHIK